MAVAWIKGAQSDGGEFMCPLYDARYLMLDAIAHKLGLDPSRLLLGELLLIKDDKGNSVHDVEQLRGFSPDSGDGLSKQTAFVITGTPAATPEPDQGRSRAIVPTKIQLRNWRLQVMRRELFESEGSVFHYTEKILHGTCKDGRLPGPEDIQREVVKFVGSAHIIRRSDVEFCSEFFDSKRKRKRDPGTIMVTLVRPDGYCITAAKLLEGYKEKEHAIVVNFPRINETGCWYECKVSCVQDFTAYLEPLEKKAFRSCMATEWGIEGRYMFESYHTLKLVRIRPVDMVNHDKECMAVAVSRVGKDSIGGPVLDIAGYMKGVVVDTNKKLAANAKSKNKPKSLCGWPLKVSCKTDFDEDLWRCELWKEIRAVLGEGPLPEHEVLLSILKTNQLVEYSYMIFKTPQEQWFEAHPLEEYVEEVTKQLCIPVPKMKPRLTPRVHDDSCLERLARDQHAIRLGRLNFERKNKRKLKQVR